MLALLLIYDYLGAMGLEKTSFILYPESQAHMPHRIASGNEDELASELMVDEEAFHKRGKERSEKLRKQLNLGKLKHLIRPFGANRLGLKSSDITRVSYVQAFPPPLFFFFGSPFRTRRFLPHFMHPTFEFITQRETFSIFLWW